jgi:molybdopterin-containing oxidoreductase family membrane subunit
MRDLTYERAHEAILGNLTRPGPFYFLVAFLLGCGVLVGALCWRYQILTGIGVGGQNNPVAWGIYLVLFVFWVGIAHSGTLISAILYLFRARFRTAVARSAEAMTVFAVTTAGFFPLIHLGRIWVVHYMIPFPNQRYLWPNFNSPLMFDMVAISTYLTVSSMFWFTGLLPDLAAVRDRSSGLRRRIYGLFSLGWRNDQRNWRHHMRAYLFFAALATPLVISVHSVVSWDFALSVVPGWHSTIFAPYFVAGAIHSGLAMVITLLIPLRKVQRLEAIITIDIFEKLAKLIILTGLIVGYAYGFEYFIARYSGNPFEIDIFNFRAAGAFAVPFWIMVGCNALVPLLFFVKKIRRSIPWLLGVSILINVGMYYERYVIIISSVAHDFIPYAWGSYAPSPIEMGIGLGAFCWFFLLFWLFVRFLPTVAVAEIKEQLPPPVKEERVRGSGIRPRLPTPGGKG